jgi:hypothetical protein
MALLADIQQAVHCHAEMRKGGQIRRAGSDPTTNALPSSDNLRNTEHATCIISTKRFLSAVLLYIHVTVHVTLYQGRLCMYASMYEVCMKYV